MMGREWAAALLIAALILVSVLNSGHIDRLTDWEISELEQAEEDALAGNFDSAERRIRDCLDTWLEVRTYTYAAMRHEEVDAVFDGLYDLVEDLPDEDAQVMSANFERAIYRLRVIGAREHISIESIF